MIFTQAMKFCGIGRLLAATFVASGQRGRWADKNDQTAVAIIQMERGWAEEACTGKIVVGEILAEDFQGTAPDGKRYSKQEAVQRASKPAARDCRLVDAKVHFFGDNTALVYGSDSAIRKADNGQEYTRTLVWTDTWLKRNGKWQIAAQDMQSTPIIAPSSAREQLIGTWRLISAEDVHPDGSSQPFPEYGPHPVGYLMYDATGHMCVTLASPNAPQWADPAKPTDAERVLTHKAMEAYCGTYEVHEKEHQVIHRPELAEWPHYIASDQVRNFRFEGDRLILSLEETIPNGGFRRSRITWERVTQQVQ